MTSIFEAATVVLTATTAAGAVATVRLARSRAALSRRRAELVEQNKAQSRLLAAAGSKERALREELRHLLGSRLPARALHLVSDHYPVPGLLVKDLVGTDYAQLLDDVEGLFVSTVLEERSRCRHRQRLPQWCGCRPPGHPAGDEGDAAHPSEYGLEDVVTAAADESAQFAAKAESSNVGPRTLEQLEADIRRIVVAYPNRPIGPLFREVRGLRDRAFELLEGRQPPQYTCDLYVGAGVLCGVLANASFDLGRYDAAETQARTAFLFGELAGHNGLRCWVRGLQALISYWDGRPADALRLAEAGSVFAPESGTARVRLESVKARAFGQLNRGREAVAALSTADRLRERIGEGDELPGGMMAFPVEKQLFYASSTHLWLAGNAHLGDAEARAAEAVTIFEAAPPEQQRLGEMSLARMDLAMARLGRGDLEGAATQVHEVLGVNARRRTESVDRRIGHFNRQLALHPGAGSPFAVGLRESITAHQKHMPAQLPPGGDQ